MVEMKNGNVSPGHDAVSAGQGVTGIEDHLARKGERDERDRQEADGVEQVMLVIQEMLPQQPALGLRPDASHAVAGEKAVKGRAGKLASREELHLASEGLRPRIAGQPMPHATAMAAPAATLGTPASSPLAAHVAHTAQAAHSGTGTGRQEAKAGAVPAAAGEGDASASTAPGSIDVAHKQKEAAAHGSEPQQVQPLATESRRPAESAVRQAAPAPRPSADPAASMPQPVVDGSASQDGWVYNFRSWGEQHSVRIVPATHTDRPQSPAAALALHPSSTLVEQGLGGHKDGAGAQWIVHEYREQERQGRHPHQQQQEEDES